MRISAKKKLETPTRKICIQPIEASTPGGDKSTLQACNSLILAQQMIIPLRLWRLVSLARRLFSIWTADWAEVVAAFSSQFVVRSGGGVGAWSCCSDFIRLIGSSDVVVWDVSHFFVAQKLGHRSVHPFTDVAARRLPPASFRSLARSVGCFLVIHALRWSVSFPRLALISRLSCSR